MNKLVRNIRIVRKAICFILILLPITIVLSGCDFDWSTTVQKPDDSVRIVYNVYSETFTDEKGFPILEAKIIYPQIVNVDNKYVIDGINQYFYEQMKQYLDTIATDGVHYAQGDKEASVPGEYEFIVHSYTQTPKITYNGKGYLSLVYLRIEMTGGTRPNIYMLADSIKVTTGDRLSLTDLLGSRAVKTVSDIAAREIRLARQDANVQYFDTYKRDVERRYDPEDFYLSGKSLTVFYQTETIAPYPAGFPSFNIPYNDFRMRMKVPEIPETDEQAELYVIAEELLERNNFVFNEVYGLSMLDMDIPSGKTNETLFPVIDPRFTRYDELVSYLRETYSMETVSTLLDNGMYKDVFGSLYGNPRSIEGNKNKFQYTVNWSNFSFEILLESDTKAKLTIYTNEEAAAGLKEIKISAELVKENGKWVLSKMVY
jgi:hypothetical protein